VSVDIHFQKTPPNFELVSQHYSDDYYIKDCATMSYLTEGIQLEKFKIWLVFAVGNIVLNSGILIKGTDLMNKLKGIWPDAEIIPGIAAAGLVFAFLAGILVIIFRVQIFIEILQAANFVAILYAFYSFKPSILSLPSGIVFF
jgi:hypothetical protein